MMIPRAWVFAYALRDTRGVRGQLAAFLLSMVLGVAALVAINSIGDNLTAAADEQAKALLGADFRLSSRSQFSPDAEALIDSLGGEQARLYSFSSMAFAPSTRRTRLVGVRAADPGYPFYGEVQTDPPDAARSYLDTGGAVVDGGILTQLGVGVGDTLRIGRSEYPIRGTIVQTSRETSAMAALSPRVYIPRASLDSLLLSYGSRIDYEVFFRFTDGRDADKIGRDLRGRLREMELRYSSVEKEKREWNESLTNLYRFLSLVAFVALLLGGLGVASSMHVYIKRRLSSVAVLRCIGAAPIETTAVYVCQAFLLGLIGSSVGVLLGLTVQQLTPGLINAVSPLTIEPTLSIRPILLGLVVGTSVSVLFALLPILNVNKVSPLRVFSRDLGDGLGAGTLARTILIGVAVLGLTGAAVWQAPSPSVGIAYMAGLLVVFGSLRLIGSVLTRLSKKARLRGLSFEIKQGISALFRPGNQTALLSVTIGFVAFLVFLLAGLRATLLAQVSLSGGDDRPNLILFDIQPDQVEGVEELVRETGSPVVESVPIISMRISSINGRTIQELRADDEYRVGWAHTREYRSSYRDSLNESETLIDGRIVASFDGDIEAERDYVPVTMASDLESDLGVSIGDSIVFDVQGLPVRTVIVGTREVDWGQLRTNFYFVFPTGVLESAPATIVVVTNVPEPAALADLQSKIVQVFPNVSAIDLTIVLSVVEKVFDRIGTVIRFLALFCIVTGLLVLIGTVTSGQTTRTEESVLLKTLGASRKSIQLILATEYASIGLIATVSGLILGLLAVWSLSRYNFKIPTVVPFLEYSLILVAVVLITVAVGMVLSRAVYRQSPLSVLRNEIE